MGPAQGILNARFSMSAQPLVKKIEIRSIDPESGKQIKGEASLSGSFGKQSGKLLGNSRQVYYEAGVKDAAEAKAREESRPTPVVKPAEPRPASFIEQEEGFPFAPPVNVACTLTLSVKYAPKYEDTVQEALALLRTVGLVTVF